MWRFEALRKVPLMAKLTPAQRSNLCTVLRAEHYKQGDVIIRQVPFPARSQHEVSVHDTPRNTVMQNIVPVVLREVQNLPMSRCFGLQYTWVEPGGTMPSVSLRRATKATGSTSWRPVCAPCIAHPTASSRC